MLFPWEDYLTGVLLGPFIKNSLYLLLRRLQAEWLKKVANDAVEAALREEKAAEPDPWKDAEPDL